MNPPQTMTPRAEQWKTIIHSDPRRAVRVLTLSGPNSETVEGDNVLDMEHVFLWLREVATDTEGDTWKNLIKAGVAAALCRLVLTAAARVVMRHEDEDGSGRDPEDVAKQPAPYFSHLDILCSALVSSPKSPGPTEKMLAEQIKTNWTSMMQRVWSEPAHSLEPEPKPMRLLERAVIAQMLVHLISIDPFFLEVITNSNDLTLAILFLNWMHGTADPDIHMNRNFLLYMLRDPCPRPEYRKFFQEHPPSPLSSRVTRALLGACKAAGSHKKRTPVQAANAIVSAFTSHLDVLSISELEAEYSFLDVLLTHREHGEITTAFARAFYHSAAFWAANARVMRRAAGDVTDPSQAKKVLALALRMYLLILTQSRGEQLEAADLFIYTSVTSGLFDALEHARVMLVKSPQALDILFRILADIRRVIPRLSPKTRKALHAELPRAALEKTIMDALVKEAEAASSVLHLSMMGEQTPTPQGVWLLAAWQTLRVVEVAVDDSGKCMRRGCDRPAKTSATGHAAHACGACKATKYCSMTCLERDNDEHERLCEFFSTWEHMERHGGV